MTDSADVIRQEAAPPLERRQPAGSQKFDRTAIALCSWLMIGLYTDGWAHNHVPELETFFTPWHAVLYSGLLAVASFLIVNLIKNRLKGYSWQWALPAGYGLSILGVLIFTIGGICDFIWHSIFGIEVGVEALLSPPHLGLALGGALMVTGPLRSAWQQTKGKTASGLVAQFPMLLSLTFLLSLLTFFTQFAHPLVVPWLTHDVSDLKVDTEIYVMNLDGSGQTRLTNHPRKEDFQAAWSPDGSKIAFSSDRDSEPQRENKTGKLDIYVMNADGSNSIRLTNNEFDNSFPNWSADGSQIAFTSERDDNRDIYLMNADGSNQTRLTTSKERDWLPRWAPAGSKIAFSSNRDGNNEIYVMNTDGSGQINITNNKANDWGASWAPDSSQIVFSSDRDGNQEIYVMTANGSNQKRLTNDKGSDYLPTWSPDGKRIAFVSDREGSLEIFTMNPDGTNLTNLTNNPGMRDGDWLISWSPDGSQLTFASKGNFPGSPFFRQGLGTTSILLQTAILMGLVLLTVSRWTLPLGSLTLIFTLNAALMSVLDDQYWLILVALGAGVTADLLLWLLKPSEKRRVAFRIFAFVVPLIFYGLYFLVQILTQDFGWSVPMWTGAIVMSGIVSWLLSYLVAPPFKSAEIPNS